jgi:anaerobic ribonucleoside-triphosphate reductase
MSVRCAAVSVSTFVSSAKRAVASSEAANRPVHIGVVTLNMPRLAYLATDKATSMPVLITLMDIAARSLDIKRKTITALLDGGLYPYTKHYLGTFKNHFSTIGLVGMNEACLNARWIKHDLTNEDAQAFTIEVLNHMRSRLSDYQERYGDLFNLEATPAESTAYRLAKHDKEKISGYHHRWQSWRDSVLHQQLALTGWLHQRYLQALDIEDRFQTLYTSGTVFHAFLGQKLPNWESCMKLVRKIAENYKLPYYTMSPTYSVCADHGYISGEVWKCPICGKETEVYSRITGYYRPVKNWNEGKTQEFRDRQTYEDQRERQSEPRRPEALPDCGRSR